MAHIPVKQITLKDCLPLRHQVLWPTLTQEECIDAEDAVSTHHGYIFEQRIISCLSLLQISPIHYRVRKFATLPAFQGKGFGSSMFRFLLRNLKEQNVEIVSLNARSTAKRFYDKFNFEVNGESFHKNQVEFIPMQVSLKQLNF